MKFINKLILFSAAIIFSNGCLVPDNPYNYLAPGTWRAVLRTTPRYITPNPKGKPLPEKLNMEFDEVTDGELPFTFEVIYENENDFYLEIHNGEERIRLDDIIVGRNPATARDTIRIEFPVYNTYISALFEGNIIEGTWNDPSRGRYSIPFVAVYGDGYRFTRLRKEASLDITGKWEVMFGIEGEDPYPAIGEFVQKGNDVTGTFITETGDYRYLEGTIQANKEKGYNKLYLSTFDGSHAFLFEAKVTDDEKMIGTFRSGSHYKTTWKAKKNDNATLTDANELTFLNEGYETLDFSFENPEGKIISPSNPEYEGKVRLIQIFGTWCPNCRDETNFLKEYLAENKNPDLAVIGLAFEKSKEKERANQAIKTYRERMNLPYEMVVAGSSNKKEAAKVLPALNHVLSYPTMIFMDKKGKVRRIHTGFSGPATTEYDIFKKDFDDLVKELLAE